LTLWGILSAQENRLAAFPAERKQGQITQLHSTCDKSRDNFTHDTVVRQGQVGLLINPAAVLGVSYLNPVTWTRYLFLPAKEEC